MVKSLFILPILFLLTGLQGCGLLLVNLLLGLALLFLDCLKQLLSLLGREFYLLRLGLLPDPRGSL